MSIYYPITFFVLAALFGAILFSFVYRDRKPPALIALIHGTFALCGIVTLIICAVSTSALWGAFAIFVLAAMGGLTLVAKHVKNETIPKMIAAAHGSFALLGIVVLIVLAYLYN